MSTLNGKAGKDRNILVDPHFHSCLCLHLFLALFQICTSVPACHLRFLRACHLSQSCVGAPAFLIRLPAEKTLIRALDIDNVVYIRQSDREHFNARTGLSNSYKAFLRRRLVNAMYSKKGKPTQMKIS